MEISRENIQTAQDLFEFLSEIPPATRARLPLDVIVDEDLEVNRVEAFEVTETEGCLEQAFRIVLPDIN